MNGEQLVKSPCVSICALDDQDICIGCQRTAHEISHWGRMGAIERREVLSRCAERIRAAGQFLQLPAQP